MTPTSATDRAGKRKRSIDKPEKPGRFEPTEPLHMVTRHNARKFHTTNSSSMNRSVFDDESRRASLDEGRPATSHSLGSQGRRISGASTNGASDMNMSFESHLSSENKSRRTKSRTLSSPPRQPNIHESPSPSRKRKRSTASPQGVPNVIAYAYPSVITEDPDSVLDAHVDAVVVGPESLLSDHDSEDYDSDEQDGEDFLAATQSTEITPAATPAASEPVSPVSDESRPTLLYTLKHIDVSMGDVDQMLEADEADGGEDLVEGEDGLDEDDVEDDDDQGPIGRKKRIHGRRRADHPVPEIEARMRRQLQLKSAFRSISRAIKPLLAEIAEKTIDELESDPKLHEEAPEYQGSKDSDGVKEVLDDYLLQRKAQLEAQRRHYQAQLRKTLDGEKQVRKSKCENEIEDIRQRNVDHLHHDFLLIARRAQLYIDSATHETDDEDGDVIPRPKGMAYRWKRKEALDHAYDSRSRLAMAADDAIVDLQRRIEMHDMLRSLDDDDRPEGMDGFTVMDDTAREAAREKTQALNNTLVLAEAAATVQREIPVIPNEQARGLQLLGDLASRPSIRATVPAPPMAPLGPQLLRQPVVGSPAATQMLPPPTLRPPISFERGPENGPLRAQMSPRTERFVAERGALSFLPQSPLRQPSAPENRLSEAHVPSPSSSASRGNAFQSLKLKPFGLDGRSILESPRLAHHHRHGSHDSFDRRMVERDRPESSHSRASGMDDAPWEKHPRPMTADSESRSLPQLDRTIHEFSRGGPLSIERISTQPEEACSQRPGSPPSTARPSSPPRPSIQLRSDSTARPSSDRASESRLEASPLTRLISTPATAVTAHAAEQRQAPLPDHVKDESPPLPVHPLPAKPLHHWEPPSSEGAADSRLQDEVPLLEDPKRDLSLEVPTKKSRSRASSLGRSTATDVSGSQDGSNVDSSRPHRHGKDGSRSQDKLKTSRSDRHGLSRKQHKERRKGSSHTTSLDGGQMLRFRLNTTESPKPSTTSSGPPTGTPHVTHPGFPPYPPLPAYNEHQAHPFPPPHGYPPPPPTSFYGYDHHQYFGGHHRNSLPGVPPPPWPQHPPSPAYGLPHGPHPPPSGWPGSPSNGLAPPPQLPGQQSPAPQTASRSGGPPIAPATPESRAYGYGSKPAGGTHPPAFAQQQRNNESSSSRRRAQSDVRGTKFHHYSGPRNRDQA